MKYIQFCDINNTQYTIALNHLVGTKAVRPYTGKDEDEIYYVFVRDLPPIHVSWIVYNQIHTNLYETNNETIFANG